MAAAQAPPQRADLLSPAFVEENEFIRTLTDEDYNSLRDYSDSFMSDVVGKRTALKAVNPNSSGPLFDPGAVDHYSKVLFSSVPGRPDSNIICKNAILHLLKNADINIVRAFCVRCIKTCKNAVSAEYILYSFFSALDPTNDKFDIGIQVCLTDFLVDIESIDPIYLDTGKDSISSYTEYHPEIELLTYNSITDFLNNLDKLAREENHLVLLNTLFKSTVAFIIAQFGESQATDFKKQWSVNLICTFVDEAIRLYGSGQGLITMFLISVVLKRFPLACLELARSYINMLGLFVYTKLGFARDRERLLWAHQDEGWYFYDPSNLQMSIDLVGVTPVTPDELIRRFKNAPWPGPGNAPELKHPLSKVIRSRVEIPLTKKGKLFSRLDRKKLVVNDTQLETAVVLNMIECIENMIECLNKGLDTPWRDEDFEGKPQTFRNLHSESLDRLKPAIFAKRFDYPYDYSFCEFRIARIYGRVNRNKLNPFALHVLLGELNTYIQELAALAAVSTAAPVKDPIAEAIAKQAKDDAAAAAAAASAAAGPKKPNFVSIRETRAKYNKDLLDQLLADSTKFDTVYTDEAADDGYTEGEAAFTDAVSSSGSGNETPPVRRVELPIRYMGSVQGLANDRRNRPTQQRREETLNKMKAFRQEKEKEKEKKDDTMGGGKKTKNKRNKNKPKTKRRAANKKNKKAHAGRVSRHNKVFRRKTRKSK